MNSRKDIQTVVTTHRMADVFPTIDTELGKVVSNQMDRGGGVHTRSISSCTRLLPRR